MDIHTEFLGALKDLSIRTNGVSSETRLKEDLEMDSTELVELSLALEKRLATPIDDAILGKLSFVGKIEQFLESLMGVVACSSGRE